MKGENIMPRPSRKVHIIREMMDNRYVEEKHPEYVKYYNDGIEVLKQKSFYMVVDKRDASGVLNVYTSLNAAHKNIVAAAL